MPQILIPEECSAGGLPVLSSESLVEYKRLLLFVGALTLRGR
jgi:hypothetical protein